MDLKDIEKLFSKELLTIYSKSECIKLFYIFAEHILELPILKIRTTNKKISAKQKEKFISAISELKIGKPYQQILGKVHFYNLDFFIDKNVLIPRPETEELLHLILSEYIKNKKTNLNILDIGTGSGCIPITLAKHLSNAKITSIDISENALNIAKKNAVYHNVKINFTQKDYLKENLDDVYDIIISNPPYIAFSEEKDIKKSVKNFEPKIALFAPKNNPLAFYEKIAQDTDNHLSKGGVIFLEINQNLGEDTLNIFTKKMYKSKLIQDLSGNNRFIISSKMI